MKYDIEIENITEYGADGLDRPYWRNTRHDIYRLGLRPAGPGNCFPEHDPEADRVAREIRNSMHELSPSYEGRTLAESCGKVSARRLASDIAEKFPQYIAVA